MCYESEENINVVGEERERERERTWFWCLKCVTQ